VVAVLISRSAGEEITKMMDSVAARGTSVMVGIEPEARLAVTEARPASTEPKKAKPVPQSERRVLFLNGHPLLNTRLMI